MRHSQTINAFITPACVAAFLFLGCNGSTGGSQPGTGGHAGTGGMTSAGGTTSSGGTSASGGTSGSGGVVGTGGKPGSGGTAGTGGTLGSSGGSTSSGGVLGSGGRVSTGGQTGPDGSTGTAGGTSGGGGGADSGGNATGGASGGAGAGGSKADAGSTPADSGSSGGSSGTCPTTTLSAGDHNESITSGGESRTFIVRIPTGLTAGTPAPAIIDFHPLGGNGSGQEGSSGWKAKCDSVGCISVYPDSSKKAGDSSWNAGYCCDNSEKDQIDDVQFARDIIKWLEANTCVDAKRIYASGGSNGGGMTYRMACEASDVIAAVAPVDFRCVTGKDPLASAGSVTASNNTACVCPNLKRPITVVAWDESADTSIVPYGGGQTPQLATDCPPSGSCVGIGFTSAQINAQTWADFSTCTGSATTDPDNSLCKTWTSCQGNTTVSLCSTTSGGHLAVYSNSSAKWTDMAWNKLKTQSLP